MADQALQLQGLLQLEHTHLRFGFVAGGRFQPQLGHAEQAVQQVLVHHHVMDAGEGNLAAGTFEDAAADAQGIGADAVAVAPVAGQRRAQHGCEHRRDDPVLVGQTVIIAAAAEHQQRHQRYQQLLDLLLQREQPRPRMQPAFFSVHGRLTHSASSS